MNKSLTNIDIGIIFILIVLILIKNIYNLYILYIYRNEDHKFIRQLFKQDEKYPFFNIFHMFSAFIYLFSAIYFYVTNKIKNVLFGLFCFFIFARAIGYFGTKFVSDIPFLSEEGEDEYIYYNIEVVSILAILFSLYLIKFILVG